MDPLQTQPSIQVKYANVGQRITAWIIDACIFGMLSQGLEIMFKKKFGSLFAGEFEILLSLILFLFISYLTSSVHQGSPGKVLLNIKVTDLYGNRISFRLALKRYGIYYIAYLIPHLILYFVLITFSNQLNLLNTIVWFSSKLLLAVNSLPIIGFIMIAATRHNQALHDKLFNTLVLKRR